MDFADAVVKALKYAVDEQGAFEKAIDANPLDATNHLVYADWLQENGHEDEAAFRRAMGEWHRANPDRHIYHRPDWVTERNDLPKGVDFLHISKTVYRTGTTPRTDALYDHPYLNWSSYRDMERGLRSAFGPTPQDTTPDDIDHNDTKL